MSLLYHGHLVSALNSALATYAFNAEFCSHIPACPCSHASEQTAADPMLVGGSLPYSQAIAFSVLTLPDTMATIKIASARLDLQQ